MKVFHSRTAPTFTASRLPPSLALALCCGAMAFNTTAWSAGVSDDPSASDDNGFTILSNATNVTHWGLGAGVGIKQSPYKGYGADVSPFPMIFFDDKWVHIVGTHADVKIGSWDHVSVALRLNYALGDGYRGSDADILNGMQTRKGAFWFGPSVNWRTSLGVASASFLTAGNKGQQASVDFTKTFTAGGFHISPHIGADWKSSKYVNYYYGVMPSEAEPGRPAYEGKAAYTLSFGTRVDYRFTQHQSVSLDVGLSHLTSGITDSPLVGKKTSPEVAVAYVYQFR